MLLYPIPAAVRTIRLIGGIKKAAPTDDTAGNVWMTEGFELIRVARQAAARRPHHSRPGAGGS